MAHDACSGRFLLRIDPSLHAALRQAAAAHGLSLNAFCARRLAHPMGMLLDFPAASAALQRANDVIGGALIGMAVFGSWARGEPTDASDVDVLVVADENVPIARTLYRKWDEEPVRWEGRPVDPHFTRLPTGRRPPSALWAEVAIDGMVLIERELRLSAHLAAVRRVLAAGRLRRRTVHGQGYWTEVA
ncbi:MAG: nucleotidyltransferase domain-containing protein [Rhodospirillales bacterium]|nr:nucleotidyltransferase domain-containing protein [Rhodospirillales bacterium]